MPGYRLTEAAARDIERIFLEGLAMFGPGQADKYHAGLAATLNFLALYPRAARLRDEIAPPVRAFRYESHLIVYEIGADDFPLILRIRHVREDWMDEELLMPDCADSLALTNQLASANAYPWMPPPSIPSCARSPTPRGARCSSGSSPPTRSPSPS